MSCLSQCIIKLQNSFLQNIEVESLAALKERLDIVRIILNQMGWKKIADNIHNLPVAGIDNS